MNAKQSNTLKMGHAVSDALETITATNDVPALRAKHVTLKAILNQINTASAEQAEPLTGQTRTRDKAFTAATDAGLAISGLVLSYAQEYGLHTLIAKVAISRSELQRGRFARRVEMLKQIHAAATSALAELADYRVTAEALADLQQKIDAASALLVVPRTGIVSRRVATTRLAADFSRLAQLLATEVDPVIESLRVTAPDDYARYQAARLVVDLPGSASAKPAAEDPAAAGASPAATVARAA
jgi:hypothetical protein